jgi:hypothetical protein
MTNRLGNRYLGRDDPVAQPFSIQMPFSLTSSSHTVVRKNTFAASILISANDGQKKRFVR